MYDVVALGESLIDFTPSGQNELGIPLFSQNPGNIRREKGSNNRHQTKTENKY